MPVPHGRWRRRPGRGPGGGWWGLPPAGGLGGAVQSVGGWGRGGVAPSVPQHHRRGRRSCGDSGVSAARHSRGKPRDIPEGSGPAAWPDRCPGMLLRVPGDFLLAPDICIPHPSTSCSAGTGKYCCPPAHRPLWGMLQPHMLPAHTGTGPSTPEGIPGADRILHTPKSESSSSTWSQDAACQDGKPHPQRHQGSAGPAAPLTHLSLLPSLQQRLRGSSCSSLA